MNKTRRRATQKHRAKDAKFTLRRKAEAAPQTSAGGKGRATATAPAASPSRPKSNSKRRAGDTESPEAEAGNAGEA
ncbi:MAG: hypothetical protein WCD37_15205 [Chloroflexia bacterium]